MTLTPDAASTETAAPELVRWMAPGPVRLEPSGVAMMAAAAFALGVAAGLALKGLAPRGGSAPRPTPR